MDTMLESNVVILYQGPKVYSCDGNKCIYFHNKNTRTCIHTVLGNKLDSDSDSEIIGHLNAHLKNNIINSSLFFCLYRLDVSCASVKHIKTFKTYIQRNLHTHSHTQTPLSLSLF